VTRPDVSVIVVSHNHAAYLKRCLDSLKPRAQRVNTEVFVVDNRSTDRTAELVETGYPWVRLIENTRRQGFAANNNRAIRESGGRHALLLNPDTEMLPGALDRLVAYMDREPRVGLCGPQLVYPDGRVQLSCRRFPTLSSVLARRTPLRAWLRNSDINRRHLMADADHASSRKVDWLLGACLMVRRELLLTVGLMDEGYYLYVEDIDWARRAWKAGWEVTYYPDARVIHHHLAKSDRVLLSGYSWHHVRSMWRYYRKHLAPRWFRLNVSPELLREAGQ
jgi:N-acetylglucosaminyl-diphospho-decaprenol L-rhamnosyltransferase